MDINTTGNLSDFDWCRSWSAKDSKLELLGTTRFVITVIILPIICLLGIVGNILILVIMNKGEMRTPTNYFFSALATSDTIHLLAEILYTPFHLSYETINDTALIWNQVGYFVHQTTINISSWITVAVALERYILLCYPQLFGDFITRKLAFVSVCIVYATMTLLTLPYAFLTGLNKCLQKETMESVFFLTVNSELGENDNFKVPYLFFQELLKFIIPLIILIFVNTRIIIALRRARENNPNGPIHHGTTMLIVVIVVFIVLITPQAVFSIVIRIMDTNENKYIVESVNAIIHTMVDLNSAVNIIIYVVFNTTFRKNYLKLFKSQRDERRLRCYASEKWDVTLHRTMNQMDLTELIHKSSIVELETTRKENTESGFLPHEDDTSSTSNSLPSNYTQRPQTSP